MTRSKGVSSAIASRDGVQQSRLAGAGRSHHQDVLAFQDCRPNDLGMRSPAHRRRKILLLTHAVRCVFLPSQNPGRLIVIEGKDLSWPQTDREYRLPHHRRDYPLRTGSHPAAIRFPGSGDRDSTPSRARPQSYPRRWPRRPEACSRSDTKPAPLVLHPQQGIRVQNDVFSFVSASRPRTRPPQLPLQLRFEPKVLVAMGKNRRRHGFCVIFLQKGYSRPTPCKPREEGSVTENLSME